MKFRPFSYEGRKWVNGYNHLRPFPYRERGKFHIHDEGIGKAVNKTFKGKVERAGNGKYGEFLVKVDNQIRYLPVDLVFQKDGKCVEASTLMVCMEMANLDKKKPYLPHTFKDIRDFNLRKNHPK